MYLLVSLYNWSALVAGNGSYILRPCGHDLHGPTERMVLLQFCSMKRFIDISHVGSVELSTSRIDISEKDAIFTCPALRNSLVFPNCEQEALVFSQYSGPSTTLRIAAHSLRVWSPLDRPTTLYSMFTKIASSRSSVQIVLWAFFLITCKPSFIIGSEDYMYQITLTYSGGTGGGVSQGPNSFFFHAVFGKIWPNRPNRLAPPPPVWEILDPPLTYSRICWNDITSKRYDTAWNNACIIMI